MSKNWQRPSRRDALLGDREGAYAIARHVRMSPQKVRRVVDMVRGMTVSNALDTLRFAPQAASEPVYKVIASAVANAESAESLRGGDLYVSQLFVDEGVTMRRIRPRAKGSASRILKRASHITAVVEPEINRGPIPPATQVVTKRLDELVAPAAKSDAPKAAQKSVVEPVEDMVEDVVVEPVEETVEDVTVDEVEDTVDETAEADDVTAAEPDADESEETKEV